MLAINVYSYGLRADLLIVVTHTFSADRVFMPTHGQTDQVVLIAQSVLVNSKRLFAYTRIAWSLNSADMW